MIVCEGWVLAAYSAVNSLHAGSAALRTFKPPVRQRAIIELVCELPGIAVATFSVASKCIIKRYLSTTSAAASIGNA